MGDWFNYSGQDDSGGGSTLDAIEGIIGAGAGAASTVISAQQGKPIYSQGPYGTYITGGAATAHAATGGTSLFTIVILVVVALFAFKAIRK